MQMRWVSFILVTFCFFNGASLLAGEISSAVEKEVLLAIEKAKAEEQYTFPSDPLLKTIFESNNVTPEQLTELAMGLIAVYPDFDDRAPAATDLDVISTRGEQARLKTVELLVKERALTRASDPAVVRKCFVKVLSLEPVGSVRTAITDKVVGAEDEALTLLAEDLGKIAFAPEDSLRVADGERERGHASLSSLVSKAALTPHSCPWAIRLQTVFAKK